MNEFCFEGKLLHSAENAAAFASVQTLEEAMKSQTVLESICDMCDGEQNMHFKWGNISGVIPKSESAIGAEEGLVKDIAVISKVGKPVQFIVHNIVREGERYTALLSRKAVQLACRAQYVASLCCGDVIEAKVTHTEPFGAFVDIGAGLNSLIPIDMLSVSRIAGPEQRVHIGQQLRCVVRSLEGGKITLSLRELLGTWEENAALFAAGQTVKGIVRSVESYGVFIELTPNLAGLAEYDGSLRAGQGVSVYIKSIIPEKMKVKLSVIDVLEDSCAEPIRYFLQTEHIDAWRYSPPGCQKIIETRF